jgi:hypothetical protein
MNAKTICGSNRKFKNLFVVLGLMSGTPVSLLAQDTRHVTEPVVPTTCAVFHAPLQSTPDGPKVGPNAIEQDAESAAETATLQADLGRCAGQSVELALGSKSSYNAFLINPITVPAGTSIIIDGGVTVFASRDPENYQDTSSDTNPDKIVCGSVGQFAAVKGCIALLTLTSDSGIYGYGVLDGQGNRTVLTVTPGVTWWDLTNQKHGDKTLEQSSPDMIATGTVKGSSMSNFTLYKITIRNPPYHTVDLGGTGVTVWGVKIQAPWNVPNTDGFDLHGTNITIYDTTVANGDQEIAVGTGTTATTNVTVDHFNGYSKGGIALLGNGVGISQMLVQNVNITGDLPSVAGTTVNGVPETVLTKKYGLMSYGQALPNATNDLNGLQINTNINASSQSKPGVKITDITFKSICIQDIVKPIHVGPLLAFTSTDNLPSITGITFQDIHILAPTSQFPELSQGIPTTSPATSGSYQITFEGYPQANPPDFINQLVLNNVVFDDSAPGASSLSQITAGGNNLTTATNVYPSVLNGLTAPYSASPVKQPGSTTLTLSANSYASTTQVNSAAMAYACPSGPLPFTTGELYVSATNLPAAWITAGESVTLNAVVQPIMSQTTQFMPNSYGANPGLLAVGSPELRNPIRFYEGTQLIGTARLSANGTLASLVVKNIAPGTHTYTARYPADSYYAELNFGSVTVDATPTAGDQ